MPAKTGTYGMPTAQTLLIDASQFPAQAQESLLESLRRRLIPSRFHYESYKQARLWLALHEAYSPVRRDPDCAAIYDHAFTATAGLVTDTALCVVGLGCGGGQKDARLLEFLSRRKIQLSYIPCDVSVPLVLAACRTVAEIAPAIPGVPLVCDLAASSNLAQSIDQAAGPSLASQPRIFTFFGLLPNFDPALILPRLTALLRKNDWLLISANLAPGADYAAAVQNVLAGYDNTLTRDWLLTFLLDLGVERGDGEITFSVEDSPEGYKRIVADYQFLKPRRLEVYDTHFDFAAKDRLRLFFSYRYTPSQVATLLQSHQMPALQQWLAASGEEAVFLSRHS